MVSHPELCLDPLRCVYEAGNGHGFRVHKVEPMLGDWPITVTRGFHCSHE